MLLVAWQEKQSQMRSFVSEALLAYSLLITKRPVSFLCLSLLLYMIGVGIGFARKPVLLDMNMEGLTEADSIDLLKVKAADDGLEEASMSSGPSDSDFPSHQLNANCTNVTNQSNLSNSNKCPDSESGDSSEPLPRNYSHWWAWAADLSFYYVAKRGNAFDREVLDEIREFESDLRALGTWKKLCPDDYSFNYDCSPGLSFIAYMWPSVVPGSRSNQTHLYTFDGLGRHMLDLQALLSILETSKDPLHDPRNFLPSDVLPLKVIENAGVGHIVPAALASHFRFRIHGVEEEDAEKEFEGFVKSEVFPYFSDMRQQLQHVDVWLYCRHTRQWELEDQFMKDTLWLLGSMVFFVTYMSIVTDGGIVLSILTFLVVLASVPVGYVLLPTEKTMSVSGFVVFLLVGVGADNAFVFISFWKQSKSMERRLEYTLAKSAGACLVTSIATSASFFGNLVSALRPLRELGFMTGVCVLAVFFLLLIFLPPMLLLSEQWCQERGRARVVALSDDCSLVAETHGKSCADMFGMQATMARWGRTVALAPKCILIVFVVTFVVFTLAVAISFKIDVGVPDLVPESHNFVAARRWRNKFDDYSFVNANPKPVMACSPGSYEQDGCNLFWCDAMKKLQSSQIVCDSRLQFNGSSALASDSQNCSLATINTFFVSQTSPSSAFVSKAVGLVRSSSQALLANLNSSGFVPRASDAAFAYEDWYSGSVRMSNVFDMGSYNVSRPGPHLEYCQIDIQCSLGEDACEMQGWQHLGTTAWEHGSLHQVPPARGEARRLVDYSKEVRIVWGIVFGTSFQLLGETKEDLIYHDGFEPLDPWAQRSMSSLCRVAPLTPALTVIHAKCWLTGFRDWLIQRGDRFPSRQLTAHLEQWMREIGGLDIGYNRDTQKMLATSVTFYVQDDSLDAKDVWDTFIAGWNHLAPLTANHAYACSTSWSDEASNQALITGSIDTVVIVCVVAMACVFASTFSIFLSITSVFLVLYVIVCLMFLMICVEGWTLGPIEMLGIIAFVGYATTYPIHVAHAYVEVRKDSIFTECMTLESTLGFSISTPDKTSKDYNTAAWTREVRRLRVIIALCRIGGAVVSSTISTCGVAFFLLPCQMVFFRTLGAMLIYVTLLACGASLIILPAILIVADACTCCTWKASCSSRRHDLNSTSLSSVLPDCVSKTISRVLVA